MSPSLRGVLLTVAYEGTEFHGWAAQRNTRTVEETVRGALVAIDPRAIGPRGTSRTDSGVHAEGQRAAFDSEKDLASRSWVLALNQHLPDDVCVRAAQAVPAGFAPRFAASWKRYRYRILVDQVRDPIWRTRAWRLGGPLDVERMTREARAAVGTHDFAAFRAAGDERLVTTRTVTSVAIESAEGGRLVSVVVEGTAFLYNMVRILTGTLVEVGQGRRPEGTVARALSEKIRGAAGMTAPAHGLTLEHVSLELPEGAGEPWPR